MSKLLPVRLLYKSPNPAGAFASAALTASSAGLCVIPCGGPDGKKPMVNWGRLGKERNPEKTVLKMVENERFQSANLGIVTEPSRITVIDCDTPGRQFELENPFGTTPVVVGTPRGGLHLYYRSYGERCSQFTTGDMHIDVKGRGGFVVAPPSVRPSTDAQATSYRFLEGDWKWFEVLPPLRVGALEDILRQRSCADGLAPRGRIQAGQRNSALFQALIRLAGEIDTQDELLNVAIIFSSSFAEPLPMAEIKASVKKVWSYKASGTLFGPSSPVIQLPKTAHSSLKEVKNGTDGQMLLVTLIENHAARVERGESFVIVPRAMTKARIIGDWGEKRYRAAIGTLIELGLIRIVHEGGAGPGDANQYLFGPTMNRMKG